MKFHQGFKSQRYKSRTPIGFGAPKLILDETPANTIQGGAPSHHGTDVILLTMAGSESSCCSPCVCVCVCVAAPCSWLHPEHSLATHWKANPTVAHLLCPFFQHARLAPDVVHVTNAHFQAQLLFHLAAVSAMLWMTPGQKQPQIQEWQQKPAISTRT